MTAPRKSSQDLALALLTLALREHAAQARHERLDSTDAAPLGVLQMALSTIISGEADKAAELLREAIKMFGEPVPAASASSRAQEQRNRILGAAVYALKLLEQSGYRGSDRRKTEDRRDGEDRRELGAEPAVLEQRCGEDRRGGTDRRNPLRNALFKAGSETWDASFKLAQEVVPLLHVCEIAAHAQHTLSAFDFWATQDNALMGRLNRIDPEWRVAVDDARTGQRIAQCLGMARRMAEDLADSLSELSEQTSEAGEVMAAG